MKCPLCGAEIREGSLYCEKCGEDVHIVPDFEPELEETYQKAIGGMTEAIWEGDPSKQPEEERPARKKRMVILITVPIAVLALVIVFVTVGLFRYSHPRLTPQEQAQEAFVSGDYEKAIRLYEELISEQPEDVSLKEALSGVYQKTGEEVLYENLLWEIAKSPYADSDQVFAAYEKILTLYYEMEDYASIADILETSGNEELQEKYRVYRKQNPVFDIPGGYYEISQVVRLSMEGEGTILFSLNGGEEETYSMPVFLESGDYTIEAYTINAYGIASDHVTEEYHIEAQKPVQPVVSPFSGSFEWPILIAVTDLGEQDPDAGGKVFYSMDDETKVPDIPYTGPIPMPLGDHTFRFLRKSPDGPMSDVVERRFSLELSGAVYSVAEAAQHMEEQMSVQYSGRTYAYRFPLRILDCGDYYVFEEYASQDDAPVSTGRLFGFNYYDASIEEISFDGRTYSVARQEENHPETSGE